MVGPPWRKRDLLHRPADLEEPLHDQPGHRDQDFHGRGGRLGRNPQSCSLLESGLLPKSGESQGVRSVWMPFPRYSRSRGLFAIDQYHLHLGKVRPSSADGVSSH